MGVPPGVCVCVRVCVRARVCVCLSVCLSVSICTAMSAMNVSVHMYSMYVCVRLCRAGHCLYSFIPDRFLKNLPSPKVKSHLGRKCGFSSCMGQADIHDHQVCPPVWHR